MTPIVLLILGLASFRVTRLIVDDALLDRPRRWLHARFPIEGDEFITHKPKRGSPVYIHASQPRWRITKSTWIGKLTSCHYCTGVWVSTALWAAQHYGGHIAWWPIVVAAIAGLQAFFGALDQRVNR